MITAGIDIGTNTVRLIVVDFADGKIQRIIYQNRAVTRLGEGFINSGILKPEAIKRTINAVVQFYGDALTYGAQKIKCCATSAAREAENGYLFVSELSKKGIPVEIIDGKMEGYLTSLGVMSGIDTKNSSSLIIDVGGGSSEFILCCNKKMILCQSFKIGVVKLADLYNVRGICDENVLTDIRKHILSVISGFNFDIQIDNLIATAGTPTTIAAIDLKMTTYDQNRVNGYKMNRNRIENILLMLCSLNIEERKNITGLEPGREDLIIPGAVFLLTVMDKLGKNELIVSDYGLREGIAIAASS